MTTGHQPGRHKGGDQPSKTAATKGTRELCVQVNIAVCRRADRGNSGRLSVAR
jgi:hypothetical protein